MDERGEEYSGTAGAKWEGEGLIGFKVNDQISGRDEPYKMTSNLLIFKASDSFNFVDFFFFFFDSQ